MKAKAASAGFAPSPACSPPAGWITSCSCMTSRPTTTIIADATRSGIRSTGAPPTSRRAWRATASAGTATSARLWCEGVVSQATVFGENLQLTRRIEVKAGTNEIELHDSVVNRGFYRTPHMYMYHVNVGHPVVAEGSRYLAPITDVVWAAHAGPDYRKQKVPYHTMPAPRQNFREQVWQHELAADRTRRGAGRRRQRSRSASASRSSAARISFPACSNGRTCRPASMCSAWSRRQTTCSATRRRANAAS